MTAPTNQRPTNDVIREVFLAHGFKVPEGLSDMRPYVYEAARDLLRAYGVWIREDIERK